MKKLIALLVVFALLAGSVFAIDVSGGVIGTVKLLEGNSVKTADREGNEVSDIGAGGAMGRIRLEGSGEAGDNFGGWLRIEGAAFNEKAIMGAVAAFMPDDPTAGGGSGSGGGTDPDDESAPGLEISDLFNAGFYGIAWWKPIDQLKLSIGGNPDGIWGKDGVTRWGFYLEGGDAGVAAESWAFDASFFGGFFNRAALMLEITPMDMLAVNIGIPFSDGKLYSDDGDIKDVYLHAVAQLALNFDFGTIALTYEGGTNDKYKVGYSVYLTDPTDPKIDRKSDPSKIYAYFGLTMIENLGIDVGIGFPFPNKGDKDAGYFGTIQEPIAAGLGVSFATDVFGVKFRAQGAFAGGVTPDGKDKIKDPFVLDLDVLPYYAMNDNVSIFLSAGLHMVAPDEGDSDVDFHINPYIQVGKQGPSFWAGFKLWSDGKDPTDADKAKICWAIPIGLTVAF
jgi:hypothetical protein